MQDRLHAMTIWLLGKQRPLPVNSQSTCRWLGGGWKNYLLFPPGTKLRYSVSNCSLVTVSNELTRLTYKTFGSNNHMSLETNGLGWLTGRKEMEGNKSSVRVTGLECRNVHHQWDMRRNTSEVAPITVRKALLSERSDYNAFQRQCACQSKNLKR